MRKSRTAFFLVLAALAISCFPISSQAVTRWKTSSLAPKDVGYYKYVVEILFPALKEACNNDLAIKGYWGGVLGDDKQALKNMRIGKIQASGLSGQGTFTACPEVAVMGLPFLFTGYEEVDFLKIRTLDTFDKLLAPRGLRILAWLDQDFDETYSSEKPLAKLEDFSGVRFATWFGPLEGKLLQRLGASPSPIEPIEIPSAMRMGAADAVIAPSIWIVGTQLYTTMKYVNPLKLRYTPAFFVVSADAFDALPPAHQENIKAARLGMAAEFNFHAREELQRYLDAMIGYGIQKVKSSPGDIEDIRRRATPLWYELSGELYPQDLLSQVLEHLAEYRSASPDQRKVLAKLPDAKAAPVSKPKVAAAPRPATKPLAEKTVAKPETSNPLPARATAGSQSAIPNAPARQTSPSAAASDPRSSRWNQMETRIRQVQHSLQLLGYYNMKVDGIVGPVTFRGIRNFQRDHGLSPTGRIDQSLIQALDQAL